MEEEEFLAIIKENKMEDDCILRLEYIPNDSIPYYFKATDVVVLPYRKIYSSGVLIRSLDLLLISLALSNIVLLIIF